MSLQQRVLDSMVQAKELARALSGNRKLFTELVSEPLPLMRESTSMDTTDMHSKMSTMLIKAMSDVNDDFSKRSRITFNNTTTVQQNWTLKGNMAYEFMYYDRYGDLKTIKGSITLTTQTKVVRMLRLLMDEFNSHTSKEDNVGMFSDNGYNIGAKAVANSIKALSTAMWLCFTDVDYPQHYARMHKEQNVSSCMSQITERYGNMYEGGYVHPLEGYHKSPDFRLGLVTVIDPSTQEFLDSDYPFVARVVVFNKDGELGYGKYYGNEYACNAIRNILKYDEPQGCQLFAIYCDNSVGNTAEHWRYDFGDTCRTLVGFYDSGKTYTKGHLIAPYVDPYCNNYELCADNDIAGSLQTIELDGVERRVLPIKVTHDDNDYCFTMHYANGCLMYSQNERGGFEEDEDNDLPYRDGLLTVADGRLQIINIDYLKQNETTRLLQRRIH